MDENFLLTAPNGEDATVEQLVIDDIRNQLCNVYGDFTGSVSTDTNYIMEYMRNTHDGDDEMIENFEFYCSVKGIESDYDVLAHALVNLFKQYLGVNIDINRENVYFSDLYDIYCTFVISLKSTILASAKNHYINSNIPENLITNDNIREYCLSDEFSATDHFIKNAATYSGDVALQNLKSKVDDFTISLDQEVFGKFIYDYIVTNDIVVGSV